LPSFYGYLPDEGNKRTIMYVCMVVNSALLLLFRSIGAALLMLADTKIFVAYMAGDHLLYLLVKLARGDFLHWLPVEGVGGLFTAILMRVVSKTLTDFTGILQLRGAGEVGGAMWLWTMFLSLVAPWVAALVYFAIPADADEEKAGAASLGFGQSDAFRLLGGLSMGWILAFGLFLSLMAKKYRSSFWSMETGSTWIQSYFLQGEDDLSKSNIITKNKGKWKAIEPQVKEWVREGWVGWEREKPAWFTDPWKAKVPVDWVPKEGRGGWKKARESERRRSSVGLGLGGGGSIIYAAD
jgi:hypothetical protein